MTTARLAALALLLLSAAGCFYDTCGGDPSSAYQACRVCTIFDAMLDDQYVSCEYSAHYSFEGVCDCEGHCTDTDGSSLPLCRAR